MERHKRPKYNSAFTNLLSLNALSSRVPLMPIDYGAEIPLRDPVKR